MKVLLVAADPSQGGVLVDALARRGHDVRGCGDAEAAWQTARAEYFPLIVVDDSPTAEGTGVTVPELCRRLRALPHGANSVVFAIIDDDSPATVEPLLAAGVDDYLARPLDRQILNRRLAILERRAGELAARRRPSRPRAGAKSNTAHSSRPRRIGCGR